MAGLDDLSDDELLALHQQAAPDADRDYLIRTVYGEARGEPPEGQKAVASVILNRARQSGKPIRDVVLAPAQFTPWHDPKARAELTGLTEDSPEYRAISDNIASALDGDDPTGGADHFYAPKLADPTWAHGQQGHDIGNHRFLKLGYGGGSDRQVGGSADDDLSKMSDAELQAAYEAAKGSAAPAAATPAAVAPKPAQPVPQRPIVPMKAGAQGKPSELKGFVDEFARPYGNVGRWIRNAGDAMGLEPAPWLKQMAGNLKGAEARARAEDPLHRFTGRVPGKIGQFTGSVAGTAPLALLPGGVVTQGAASGAVLSDANDVKGVAKDAAIGAAAGKLADVGLNAAGKAIPQLLGKAPKVMDLPALKAAKQAAYDAVDKSGFVFPKTDVSALVNDFANTVKGSALSKTAKDDAHSIIQYARTLAKGDLPLGQLEKLRGDIYEAMVKKGGDTGKIGGEFRAKIDALMDTVNSDLVRNARELNARYKKADYVTRMSKSADRAAERTYGGDYGRKVKDRLNPLVDEAMPNKNLRNGTPDELKAIERVVRGTKVQNLASTAGGMLDPRRLGGKILAGVTGPGGAMGAAPTGGLSLLIPALQMGAGFGLTGIASSTARRNVDDLLKLIAAGGSRQALKKVPTRASKALAAIPMRARAASGLIGASTAAQADAGF